jgi:hypothetical protein
MKSILFLSQRGRDLVPDVASFYFGLPDVSVWTWDYTGSTENLAQHVSLRSPGGGTTLARMIERMLPDPSWDYLGGVAHDIHGLTPTAVQMMLDSARTLRLAAFAPGHADPGGVGWPHMHAVPGSYLRYVDWVESRAVWLRRDVCASLLPYLELSQSGYGVDCYALPSVVRRVCPDRRIAVFDSVPTYHVDEPGRSARQDYRGMTARAEMELVRQRVELDEGIPVPPV